MPSSIDWPAQPDGALARLIASGGADAGAAEAELCRRFVRRVRLYGLRHLRSAAAAEDLAQRVILLTLQKLRGAEVREPDRIGSFVLGVARMLTRDERRGARNEVAVSSDGAGLPWNEPVEPDPLAAARLARCLGALADRERTVVVLTYYGEASTRDIAARLAVAEGHVRVIRHRAMARLRACMDAPAAGPTASDLVRGGVVS